jgi:hypothetical protein
MRHSFGGALMSHSGIIAHHFDAGGLDYRRTRRRVAARFAARIGTVPWWVRPVIWWRIERATARRGTWSGRDPRCLYGSCAMLGTGMAKCLMIIGCSLLALGSSLAETVKWTHSVVEREDATSAHHYFFRSEGSRWQPHQ